MSERNFDKNPRRVVVQMEFYVYDGIPCSTIQEITENVVADESFREMVLLTVAEGLEVGMSLNDITVTTHDQ